MKQQNKRTIDQIKWRTGLALLFLFFFGFSAIGNTPKTTPREPLPLETRCGWFSNPTPANIWLYDRDGEWLIGVQGGYQIKGNWPWPAFKSHEWVKTNGNYGYGCVCLKLQADRQSHHVHAIKSAKVRPLAACQQDQGIKKWNQTVK